MVNEDETEFIKKVVESGDFFLDDKGNILTPGEVKDIWGNFWIISPQSKIIKMDNGFIDDDRVDAIQFCKCFVKNQKFVSPGRLWVQLKYYSSYDESARIITKEKWLEDKYNYYKRWLVKNYKGDKGKGLRFYIGRETYRLYKEEGWKMMTSPVNEAEFD